MPDVVARLVCTLEHVLVARRDPVRDRAVPGAVEAQRDRRADGRRADAERGERHAARVLALRRSRRGRSTGRCSRSS